MFKKIRSLICALAVIASFSVADAKNTGQDSKGLKLHSEANLPMRSLAGSGVAVINMQYIFDNSIAVSGLRQKISDISNELQNQVTERKQALKRQENELINLRATAESKEYKSKLNDFSTKINDLQQSFQKKKIDLEKAHSKALARVHEKIYYIIKNFADSDHFDIVISGDNVLFVSEKYDLTKRVLDKLNEDLEEVEFDYQPK